MKWNEVRASRCPVAQAASVVGDRWTLMIVREAMLGERHFDGFEKALGISPHLLSVRLKRLVADGVLRKVGAREYRLASAGLGLQPVILALAEWGNRYRSDAAGPQASFVHTPCGHSIKPAMSCEHCASELDPSSVEIRFAPPLASERAARAAPRIARRSAQSSPSEAKRL